MNLAFTGRVNPDKLEEEFKRRSAIRHQGYTFIVLELIDFRKMRVSGIQGLNATPAGMPGKYNFTKTETQLEFSEDISMGGIFTAYVLDTEKNRKFLATHLDCGYWDVVQVITGRKAERLDLETVLEQLYELKEKLEQESVDWHTANASRLKQIKQDSIIRAGRLDLLPKEVKTAADLTEEELEAELARKRMANRIDIKGALPQETEAQKSAKIEFKRQQKRAIRKGFVADINISNEEFAKLTPAEKTKITKARNAAKREPAISVSSKKDDIVVSGKTVESEFLRTPSGMVQP